jgi:ribonuclease HI
MNAFDKLMSSQARKPVQKTSSGYLILKGVNTMEESNCYLLQFDGASKSNPGESSGGAVIYSLERNLLYETGEYIGSATNNIAEYTGLLIGLRLALEKEYKNILIEGDSQLVIQQVVGVWKVENNILKKLYREVQDILSKFNFVAIRHIRRELNTEADRVTNDVIHSKETYITEYEYI